MVGQQVGSDLFTLVDDGRVADGPGSCPFDDEGVPSGRTELFTRGALNGFLHDTYTARRSGEQRSTGNAKRGYRSAPGVGTSNFYLDAGPSSFEELLARADGGVLIRDVTGVHSGANPISGEFSVGATGLRIGGGALGEPLREMTIASTLPRDAGGDHGRRRRPTVLLDRGRPVDPHRRDDPRGPVSLSERRRSRGCRATRPSHSRRRTG